MTGLRLHCATTRRWQFAVGYHSDKPGADHVDAAVAVGRIRERKGDCPGDGEVPSGFQLATGPAVANVPGPGQIRFSEFSIGYFWNIVAGDRQKGVYYAHHGGVPRSQCYIYIMPKYDLGIFVITNQSGDQTARAIADGDRWLVEKIAARCCRW